MSPIDQLMYGVLGIAFTVFGIFWINMMLRAFTSDPKKSNKERHGGKAGGTTGFKPKGKRKGNIKNQS